MSHKQKGLHTQNDDPHQKLKKLLEWEKPYYDVYTLISRAKQLREEVGTQEDVAKLLGKDRSGISRQESNFPAPEYIIFLVYHLIQKIEPREENHEKLIRLAMDLLNIIFKSVHNQLDANPIDNDDIKYKKLKKKFERKNLEQINGESLYLSTVEDFLSLANSVLGERTAQTKPKGQTCSLYLDNLPYIKKMITRKDSREDKGYQTNDVAAKMTKWIIDENIKCVCIYGFSGTGKSILASQIVNKILSKQENFDHFVKNFDHFVWLSIKDNLRTSIDILNKSIEIISGRSNILSSTNDIVQLSDRFIESLKGKRCLLVLDGFEYMMDISKDIRLQDDYNFLINTFIRRKHNSCIVITSQKEIAQLRMYSDFDQGVLSYSLPMVDIAEVRKIPGMNELDGTDEDWNAFVNRCSGNISSLLQQSQVIVRQYNGRIQRYLADNIGGNDMLVAEAFKHLTEDEIAVLIWVMINHEAAPIETINGDFFPKGRDVSKAIEELQRGSWIQETEAGFVLLDLVEHYVRAYFIERVSEELEAKAPQELRFFSRFALMKARSSGHIREFQRVNIARPITERVITNLGRRGFLSRLKNILDTLRNAEQIQQGYIAGNILNMLVHALQFEAEIHAYDFSNFPIWQAYLRGTELRNVNFSGAEFVNCVFTEPLSIPFSVAFSPTNGNVLAVGDGNGDFHVWRLDAGGRSERCYSQHGHREGIRAIAIRPQSDLLATASGDTMVSIWYAKSGNLHSTLEGHAGPVWSVAFNPDGSLLASASSDGTIRIWDIETQRYRHILKGEDNQFHIIRSVAFHPEGNMVASGGEDGTLRLWDMDSGAPMHVLRDPDQDAGVAQVRTIAFSPDGRYFVNGNDVGSLHIWDTASWKVVESLPGAHHRVVRAISFSLPDGELLASCGEDGIIRVWDTKTWRMIAEHHYHEAQIWGLAFQPNTMLVASASDDRKVQLANAKTGLQVEVLSGYSNRIRAVAVSPNSTILATGGEDQRIHLWNLATGDHIDSLRKHTNRIRALAFTSNGNLLATGGDDRTSNLWDTQKCALHTTLEHTTAIRALAFNADGSYLAVACDDNSVWVYRMQVPWVKTRIGSHHRRLWSLTFRPGFPNMLVTSGEGHQGDRCVRFWDIDSKAEIDISTSIIGIWSIAFSPDGKILATAAEDQSLHLWFFDDTGMQIIDHQSPIRHNEQVRIVAFSPDGEMVASGSSDSRIQVWNFGSEQEHTMSLLGHTALVWTLVFSASGKLLISGGNDQTVRVWENKGGSSWQCKYLLRSAEPYKGMIISHATLPEVQRRALLQLGAVNDKTN